MKTTPPPSATTLNLEALYAHYFKEAQASMAIEGFTPLSAPPEKFEPPFQSLEEILDSKTQEPST